MKFEVILLAIFFASFVSSVSVSIDNPTIPHYNIPDETGGVTNVNYSQVDTNNSQYLQGYQWANAPYPSALYSTYNASYVPYTGATNDVNLNTRNLYVGGGGQFRRLVGLTDMNVYLSSGDSFLSATNTLNSANQTYVDLGFMDASSKYAGYYRYEDLISGNKKEVYLSTPTHSIDARGNVKIIGNISANNVCYSDGTNCSSNSTFNQTFTDGKYWGVNNSQYNLSGTKNGSFNIQTSGSGRFGGGIATNNIAGLTGNKKIDPSLGRLYQANGLHYVVDWLSGALISVTDGGSSVDWSSRRLILRGGSHSLDWGYNSSLYDHWANPASGPVLKWGTIDGTNPTLYGNWDWDTGSNGNFFVDNVDGYNDGVINANQNNQLTLGSNTYWNGTDYVYLSTETSPVAQLMLDSGVGSASLRIAGANVSTCSGNYDCSQFTHPYGCNVFCPETYTGCGGSDYGCGYISYANCNDYSAYGCSQAFYCSNYYSCYSLDETSCDGTYADVCTWSEGVCVEDYGGCTNIYSESACITAQGLGCSYNQYCGGSGYCSWLDQTGCNAFPEYCTKSYNCGTTQDSCSSFGQSDCNLFSETYVSPAQCTWNTAQPTFNSIKINPDNSISLPEIPTPYQCTTGGLTSNYALTCTDGNYVAQLLYGNNYFLNFNGYNRWGMSGDIESQGLITGKVKAEFIADTGASDNSRDYAFAFYSPSGYVRRAYNSSGILAYDWTSTNMTFYQDVYANKSLNVSNNLNVAKNITAQYFCYNPSCSAYSYYNGSALITKVT